MVLFETSNNGIKPLKLWFHFQTKQCDFSGKNKHIFAEKKCKMSSSLQLLDLVPNHREGPNPQRCHSKRHHLHKSHNCLEDLKTSYKLNDSYDAWSKHSFINSTQGVWHNTKAYSVEMQFGCQRIVDNQHKTKPVCFWLLACVQCT